jgi:hypothetical protein
VFEVPLNSQPSGTRPTLVRELSGRDEVLFAAAPRAAASELAQRLFVGAAQRGAGSLGVGDRDRILAELYLRSFGDRVDAVARCVQCGGAFGVGFSMGALLRAALEPSATAPAVEGPDAQGVYRLADGSRFRLPTVSDETEIAGLPLADSVRVLLDRCVFEGDRERAEAAMEALAPQLSVELASSCALCGAEQPIAFDVVSFFTAALARERPLLLREVHCLANAYGWSHAEIMALSRSERRGYVALVLAEADARRGARA